MSYNLTVSSTDLDLIAGRASEAAAGFTQLNFNSLSSGILSAMPGSVSASGSATVENFIEDSAHQLGKVLSGFESDVRAAKEAYRAQEAATTINFNSLMKALGE